MKTGMLWTENDFENDLETKVTNAAEFYKNNYGQKPNLCFVHPSVIATISTLSDRTLIIRTSTSIQRHHLWLGVDETPNGHQEVMTRSDLSQPQPPLPLHVSDCD